MRETVSRLSKMASQNRVVSAGGWRKLHRQMNEGQTDNAENQRVVLNGKDQSQNGSGRRARDRDSRMTKTLEVS